VWRCAGGKAGLTPMANAGVNNGMRSAIIIAATALLATSSAQADDGDDFGKCVGDNATFYGSFCHSTEDIRLAVRANCRSKAGRVIKEDPRLIDGEKAELIEDYLNSIDEQVVALVLDHRIKAQIDCGQFNNYATSKGSPP
jgi:hypothetical protein